MAASYAKFAGICLLLAATAAVSRTQSGSLQENLPLDIDAESVELDYRNNTLLFRNVRIKRGDVTVSALEAVGGSDLNFDDSNWTFRGEVFIEAEKGHLRAEYADVSFKDDRIVTALIRGADQAPATFEQRLEEENTIARGQASTIAYDVEAATVRLEGNAWLSDGRNEIRGQTLVYSIREEKVLANPDARDSERVRIIINPRKGGKDEE